MKPQIIKKIYHFLKSKRDINKLRKSNEERLKQFYEIIQVTKRGILSDQEKSVLSHINKLRTNYLNNEKTLKVMDYGSGSSSDTRTDHQMWQGNLSKKTISQIYRNASSSEKNGKFMFRIIRTYVPKVCFELGTSLGISAAYGQFALNLNGGGKYITFEGSEEIAKTAESGLKSIGLDDIKIVVGRFQDTLPSFLKKYNNIDFVFIDGHHDGNATLNYFEMFYENLNEKAILIFDDINWSKDMRDAWKKLKNDKRIYATMDMFFWGICLIDKNKTSKLSYKIWI